MEKTADEIITQWFSEYRKAKNLTKLEYVDVNLLLLFLAEQYASQFKQPSAWISVEDRLPEVGECVLCYFKDSGRIDVCSYTKVFKLEFVENAICQTNNISHWQPLPTPPSK